MSSVLFGVDLLAHPGTVQVGLPSQRELAPLGAHRVGELRQTTLSAVDAWPTCRWVGWLMS